MRPLLIQSISSGIQKPGTQLGGGDNRHDCVLKGYTQAVETERKELRELEWEEIIGLFLADRIWQVFGIVFQLSSCLSLPSSILHAKNPLASALYSAPVFAKKTVTYKLSVSLTVSVANFAESVENIIVLNPWRYTARHKYRSYIDLCADWTWLCRLEQLTRCGD